MRATRPMDRIRFLCLAAVLFLAAPAQAQTCPAPAGDLAAKIKSASQGGIDSRNLGQPINIAAARVAQNWSELFALTLLEQRLDHGANVAADMAETARTDVQIGSGASTPGTTTLTEKANLPALLSFAVERGAVQQQQIGSSLTLKATPYNLFALAEGDTPRTFNQRWWSRRVGFAGTFSLDTSKSTGAGDLDFEKFQTFGVRVNALGDRSPRSREFTELWTKKVKALDQQLVDDSADFLTTLMNSPNLAMTNERLDDYRNASRTRVIEEVKKRLATATVEDVEQVVWQVLCEDVFEPQRKGELKVDDAAMTALEEGLARQRELAALADTAMKDALKEFRSRIAVTFGWDLNRVQDGSDYSEIKLISDGTFGWDDSGFTRQPDPNSAFTLVANLSLSLNHSPGSAPKDEVVRDYGATIALERSIPNILTGRFLHEGDLSRINVSLSGEVKNLASVNDVLGSVQLKFELPIFAGVTVPVSLNYASRSETSKDDEFRINVGGLLNSDKLAALSRLLGI